MSAWIAAIVLTAIALTHSALGEASIVGPLLRDRSWRIPIPRRAADPLIRAAWHMTSLAWIALSATLVGLEAGIALGVVALVTGGFLFVRLRGHLAWPLFLVAGLYALDAADVLPTAVPIAMIGLALAVAVVAAAFHLAWGFGSRLLSAHVLPEDPETGEPLGIPGRMLVFAVAGALLTLAALTAWVACGSAPAWGWWALAAGALVLIARTFGDGTWTGLLKTVRDTQFAVRDQAFYTPLVVALAAGAISALHLAGSPLS